MMVLRGKWHWSNRANLGWQVPAGITDGFAVYTEQGEGDTFFPLEVDAEFGLSYSMQYYVSSEVEGGTTFDVVLLKSNGELIEVLQSLSGNSHPDNTEWLQASGTVPATKDGRVKKIYHVPNLCICKKTYWVITIYDPNNFLSFQLGVYCKTARANPSTEDFMWGCAVDSLAITSNGGGDTTATAGPSDAPTTAHPNTPTVKFAFDEDNAGWSLGQSNGAEWLRTRFYITNGNPPNHDFFLAVYDTDMQTGNIGFFMSIV